jgi:hypothetical protein
MHAWGGPINGDACNGNIGLDCLLCSIMHMHIKPLTSGGALHHVSVHCLCTSQHIVSLLAAEALGKAWWQSAYNCCNRLSTLLGNH